MCDVMLHATMKQNTIILLKDDSDLLERYTICITCSQINIMRLCYIIQHNLLL